MQVIAEAYVRAISTRKVEALGVTSLSKSQVSDWPGSWTRPSHSSVTGPSTPVLYTYVWADALVVKCREGGRVVNVALLVAVGVNNGRHREILGLDIATGEDGAAWLAFWRSLVARGLSGVQQSLLRRPRRRPRRNSSHPPRRVVAAVPHRLPAQPVDQGPKGGGGDDGPSGSAPSLPNLTQNPTSAQHRRVVDHLAGLGMDTAADHPDQAGAEILAFTGFPKSELAADLVQQPPRTAEQRNQTPDQRRRGLPTRASIIRLASALLAEQHDPS